MCSKTEMVHSCFASYKCADFLIRKLCALQLFKRMEKEWKRVCTCVYVLEVAKGVAVLIVANVQIS